MCKCKRVRTLLMSFDLAFGMIFNSFSMVSELASLCWLLWFYFIFYFSLILGWALFVGMFDSSFWLPYSLSLLLTLWLFLTLLIFMFDFIGASSLIALFCLYYKLNTSIFIDIFDWGNFLHFIIYTNFMC